MAQASWIGVVVDDDFGVEKEDNGDEKDRDKGKSIGFMRARRFVVVLVAIIAV